LGREDVGRGYFFTSSLDVRIRGCCATNSPQICTIEYSSNKKKKNDRREESAELIDLKVREKRTKYQTELGSFSNVALTAGETERSDKTGTLNGRFLDVPHAADDIVDTHSSDDPSRPRNRRATSYWPAGLSGDLEMVKSARWIEGLCMEYGLYPFRRQALPA